MKKKILLIAAMLVAIVCVLATVVSAQEISYDDAPAKTHITVRADDVVVFDDGFTCPSAYIFKDIKEIHNGGHNSPSIDDVCDFTYINGKAGKSYKFENVVELDIPQGITFIGQYAAMGLLNLQKVSIPDSVTSLGQCIFQQTTNLKECVFEHNENSELKTFPNFMFYSTSITSFSMPDCITKVDGNAQFSNCAELGAVYISKNVKEWYSGSQNNASFANCKKMFFVNEPFTSDNVPTVKPRVYYFPSGLEKLTGETFKNCTNLNEYIVFGTKLTDLSNTSAIPWAFNGCGNTSTIVFLGDMTGVSVSNNASNCYWNVKNIIFANPNDKSTSDVGFFGNSSKAIFCYADGNISHAAEKQALTIGATCTEAGMTYDKCFCGQVFNKVANEAEPALGHIYEQNKIVAITYADIAKNGTYTTNCDRCDHNEAAVKADSALFIYNGISTNGTGEMCVGYVINTDAINLYKQFNPEVTLDFGIVAAATDYIGENETPLGKDGNVVGANVIKTELTGNTARAVDFKLKGDFSLEENAKLNLTMGMYVILNGKVSYIYNSETDGKNEASCNADVKIVTYESISMLTK